MADLLSVVTAVPPHVVEIDAVKAELDAHLPPTEAARFARIVDGTRIRKRHTLAPVAELLRLGTIQERNQLYIRHALALGEEVARDALAAASVEPEAVAAVISVSCTGHMLPSLDAHLINRLGLPRTVRRVPMTELGCCAGVGAVALASTLLAEVRDGAALVVSVELSTLGMQVAEPSVTDMFANLLFGDGAAAAVMRAGHDPGRTEILATRSVLWPNALEHLGMNLTDTGFRLVLSPELPKVVRSELGATVAAFLAANDVRQEDVDFWIVHPGGPKILEAVEQSLALPEHVLRSSWETWAEFGNLSSANVFFVLRQLQRTTPPRAGELGVMLALGPGVTCEIVLLRAGASLVR